MEHHERSNQIRQHLEAIRQLEAEAAVSNGGDSHWPPRGYYWLFHIIVGMMLGFIGAAVSLTANVIGSLLVDQRPLELIHVYLTFPMGEAALDAESGKVLFVGCVLYLITGGLYGVVFHLLMSLYFKAAGLGKRMVIASIVGLSLWLVNFYGILSWLQPALLDGNWIVDRIPFWVAAGTHLLFAWTIALVEFWGQFEPMSARTPVMEPDTGTAEPGDAQPDKGANS